MGLLGKGWHISTNRKGQISESAIMTRFLQCGYVVLTPYGGSQRYDLVIEDADGQFWRIQCKTGRIDEGGATLKFNTSISNVTGKNRRSRNYRGQCDYFAVYNEKLNKVYLIPVDQVGITIASLRLAPSKNNQDKHMQWAKDYEL
ncbi:MAG TPA: group I intron-associated PD-(D/E)XK endonuclease [Ktedonobacteraceae bacterium]|nr:group I intron-associated PD-(D/E)XK endonuclease [Ktedonobacteraceae bacterium]